MGLHSIGFALCAVFETPAFIADLDDLAMVGEPIEEHSGHLCFAEDAGPFAALGFLMYRM